MIIPLNGLLLLLLFCVILLYFVAKNLNDTQLHMPNIKLDVWNMSNDLQMF